MPRLIGKKVSILNSSDLYRVNLKPLQEVLMWDHIHMTPKMQTLFRKVWLRRLRLPEEAELKIFLTYTGTKKLPVDSAVEYYFTRDQAVSWGIYVRRPQYWELRHALLPAGQGVSFWSGSQVPGTDFFWVTEARVRETYTDPEAARVNAGARVRQDIVLYELDLESGNLTPKLDRQGRRVMLQPDKNYLDLDHSMAWRDPSPIINISSEDGDDYLSEGIFCAQDAAGQACVGSFEFHATSTGRLKPYLKPPVPLPEAAKYLPVIECPILLRTDQGEYLFASTTRQGHHTLVVWYRTDRESAWVETNDGAGLQPNFPSGYTLYAGSLKVKHHSQVFLSGWIGHQGQVYAQSGDFELSFDGPHVRLKEVGGPTASSRGWTRRLTGRLPKLLQPQLLSKKG